MSKTKKEKKLIRTFFITGCVLALSTYLFGWQFESNTPALFLISLFGAGLSFALTVGLNIKN